MDAVRRFLRDDLQTGVDRIMAMGNNSRVVAADADVMEALYQVMHLGAGMLRYRQQHAAVMPELDSDLTPLMLALLSALGNHRPLYHRVNDLPVPREFISKHDLAEQSEDVCWIRPKLTEPDLAAADEDMQEDYEETDAWFTRLANTFGDLQGFQMIIEVRSRHWRLCSLVWALVPATLCRRSGLQAQWFAGVVFLGAHYCTVLVRKCALHSTSS
jgi:hypothetical protein